MDLALTVFNVGAGLGILAAGAGVAWLAIQATPLLRETRALAADARRLAELTDREVRPILGSVRELASNAEVLTEDVAVKLDRLTDLITVLQQRLDTVQITTAPRGGTSSPPVPASPEAAVTETPRRLDPPFWETEPRREPAGPVESWHPREE